MRLSALPAFSLLLLASACGVKEHISSMDENTKRLANTIESIDSKTNKVIHELEIDREYIRTMTEAMTSMAKSLNEFQTLAALLTKYIATQNAQATPPGNTPDIDSVLNDGLTPPAKKITD